MLKYIDEESRSSNTSEEISENMMRFCRICYSTDEETQATQASEIEFTVDYEWMHPCKCSGTIKWVHRYCLQTWLEQAPMQQRYQCTMCKYQYQSSWRLKPINRWCFPSMKLRAWDWLEISLDAVCTYFMIRKVSRFFQSSVKSYWGTAYWLVMWRCFVMNSGRVAFYQRLGLSTLSSLMEISYKNAT